MSLHVDYSLGQDSFIHPPPSTIATSNPQWIQFMQAGASAVPVVGPLAVQAWDVVSGLFGGKKKRPGPCRNLCSGEIRNFLTRCHEMSGQGWIAPNTLRDLLEGTKISSFTPENDLAIFKKALSACGGSYSPVDGIVERVAKRHGINLSSLQRNIRSPVVLTNGDSTSVNDQTQAITVASVDRGITKETWLFLGGGFMGLILLVMLLRR